MFFPSKLSVLFSMGLFATPAVVAARPDAARDGALTDHVRTTHLADARTPQSGRMGGLCQQLDCTAEQSAAIRTIRHETRERLRAERTAGHESAEMERILAGAIARIGAVLDDARRAELTELVAAHGPKIAFGGGLTAKRRGHGSIDEAKARVGGAEARVDQAQKRLAKAEKRLAEAQAATGAKGKSAAKKGLAKRERGKASAKAPGQARKVAAKARHSAKA